MRQAAAGAKGRAESNESSGCQPRHTALRIPSWVASCDQPGVGKRNVRERQRAVIKAFVLPGTSVSLFLTNLHRPRPGSAAVGITSRSLTDLGLQAALAEPDPLARLPLRTLENTRQLSKFHLVL